MMSTLKLVTCSVVLLVALISSTEGSCWRYGHSCWGGHGKRSGSSTTPRDNVHFPGVHPKLLAGLSESHFDLLGKAMAEQPGDRSYSSDEYMNSDEATSVGEEGLEVLVAEKELNGNDLSENLDESPGSESIKSEDGHETSYSWEDESQGTKASGPVEPTEFRMGKTKTKSPRSNWILYKFAPLKIHD